MGANGVREDAAKGNRHPEAVRCDVESRPGLDPDTAPVPSSAVHLDADPSGGGLRATGGGVALQQAGLHLLEGDPVAEVVLPAIPAEVEVIQVPVPGQGNQPSFSVTLDCWPVGKHATVARGMVTAWRNLSSLLIRRGHRKIRVRLPLDARCFNTPGLFGCPNGFGDAGDDHWRIVSGPLPAGSGTRATLTLVRRGPPAEDRQRRAIRRDGNHVLVVSRSYRRGHRAAAVGLLHGATPKVVPVTVSRTCPNPTTATCEALAVVLAQIDDALDLTVWTPDGLVRSAVRGHYVDSHGKPIGGYSGVNPPEMEAALDSVVRHAAGRSGTTKTSGVSRGGSMVQEIIGAAIALEAVEAFPGIALMDPQEEEAELKELVTHKIGAS